ncbi:hypothetical protein [Lentibacillus juripiscarius]|uniref:Uncharacterized protein n=1 Tax=Lentibacillus juripiscarius TaxID=257446 RepID=A0ABW5V630_9BACI
MSEESTVRIGINRFQVRIDRKGMRINRCERRIDRSASESTVFR